MKHLKGKESLVADDLDRSTEEPVRAMRGLETLEDALEAESFPMDHHSLDYAFGDIEIENGRGGFVLVRNITDKIPEKRFDSPEQVLAAIKSAVHSYVA